MTANKIYADFWASKEILSTNIEQYHSGKRELYRVAAVELRKLTCDGKNTLLSRLIDNMSLHPLKGGFNKLPKELRRGLVFNLPGSVYDSNGDEESRIKALFEINVDMLSLEEWLEQPLLNENITIRELIRSVADKESAHSDENYTETLKLTKSVKSGNEEIHKRYIIVIGEYVLNVMKEIVKQNTSNKQEQ
jgi:hypothetical protein